LTELAAHLPVPVVLKETGCGFSARTLARLNEIGVAAVDVSGFGGTHWGRIEGGRSLEGSPKSLAAQTFRNWGISTVDSLAAALSASSKFEVWASGGVRSGLDVAKALAMGAKVVGLAKPVLVAALAGEAELRLTMERFEFELRTAMFCTGCSTVAEMSNKGIWAWVNK
jgi:isopentenyl-diphosphate delta-isomerase